MPKDSTPSNPEQPGLLLPLVDTEPSRVVEYLLTPTEFAGLHESAEAAISRPENSDDLTKLGNRRMLMQQLGVLTGRHPGQYGLLMVDLDGLKEMNDTQGHAAGDELIRATARVLTGNVRLQDKKVENERRQKSHEELSKYGAFACRLGGDEFALPVPGVTNSDQMEEVVERVRDRFTQVGIAASIGGRVHQVGETSGQLLDAVDSLVYEDKRANRQRRIASAPRRKRAAYKLATLLHKYSGLPTPR